MARASQPSAAPRPGASFEVEQLELSDGHLVISGHWAGVRGMRFVRPTLVADGRRVLATLEHKPWAAAAGKPWIAAFPWDGTDISFEELSLDVAPSVTVKLDAPADDASQPLLFVAAPEPARALAAVPEDELDVEAQEEQDEVVEAQPPVAPEPPAAPEPAKRPPELASPARMLRMQDDLAEMTLERNALARRLEDAHGRNAELDERCLELDRAVRLQRRTAQEATDARDDLERARTAAERDRDRVLAQVTEAVQDREAALRTRSRMEIRCEEAIQAREQAEAKLAKAIAERDEANAQRDEVLLAYRTLQRQRVSERAEEDRGGPRPAARGARRRSARAEDDEGGAVQDADADADETRETPLGVRTMPAARTVMAELQRRQPSPKGPLSIFDLWVMRILGTVAALCFISLLVMILRVFV